MIQPHVQGHVKSTIYSWTGTVTATRILSDRPDVRVKLDDDTTEWVFSQTEIEPA